MTEGGARVAQARGVRDVLEGTDQDVGCGSRAEVEGHDRTVATLEQALSELVLREIHLMLIFNILCFNGTYNSLNVC